MCSSTVLCGPESMRLPYSFRSKCVGRGTACRARTAVPVQPCPYSRARTAVPVQPCPYSRARTAVPVQPCPYTFAVIVIVAIDRLPNVSDYCGCIAEFGAMRVHHGSGVPNNFVARQHFLRTIETYHGYLW